VNVHIHSRDSFDNKSRPSQLLFLWEEVEAGVAVALLAVDARTFERAREVNPWSLTGCATPRDIPRRNKKSFRFVSLLRED
jgi:hypothetical protein